MKKIFLLLFAQTITLFSFTQVTVQNLLCENRTNPIGLDVRQPRFSWQLASGRRGVMQTAYEIRLSRMASFGKDLIWSTGKVGSDSSVLVAYKGEPLRAEQRYYWQVRVWDGTEGIRLEYPGFFSDGIAGFCRLESQLDRTRLYRG